MALTHYVALLVTAAAAGAILDRLIAHRTVSRIRCQLAAVTHDATHDRLSGLLNRGGLEDAYHAGTDTARWMLIVDVDAFKDVNDRYGHPTGDLVLAALGTRIGRLVNASRGSGGRLGGDEFAVVLPHSDARDLAVAATILSAPITTAGTYTGAVTVSVSVGVTAVPAGMAWKHALSQADIALYQAKRGRQPVTYEPAMTYPHPPWPRRQTRDHTAREHDARRDLRALPQLRPSSPAGLAEAGEQP
jgi:diguanylate cyclase (GGDEF)-like protein